MAVESITKREEKPFSPPRIIAEDPSHSQDRFEAALIQAEQELTTQSVHNHRINDHNKSQSDAYLRFQRLFNLKSLGGTRTSPQPAIPQFRQLQLSETLTIPFWPNIFGNGVIKEYKSARFWAEHGGELREALEVKPTHPTPFPIDHKYASLNAYSEFNTQGQKLIVEMLKQYASLGKEGNLIQPENMLETKGLVSEHADIFAQIIDRAFTPDQRDDMSKAAKYRRKYLTMLEGLTPNDVADALQTGFMRFGAISIAEWPIEIYSQNPDRIYTPQLNHIQVDKVHIHNYYLQDT